MYSKISLVDDEDQVYFDWKTVIYIYVCGKYRTQFMLPMEKSVKFTGACANKIMPSMID
jgi:hypothetical protein